MTSSPSYVGPLWGGVLAMLGCVFTWRRRSTTPATHPSEGVTKALSTTHGLHLDQEAISYLWNLTRCSHQKCQCIFFSPQQVLLFLASPEFCTRTRQPSLQLVSLSWSFSQAAKSSQQALWTRPRKPRPNSQAHHVHFLSSESPQNGLLPFCHYYRAHITLRFQPLTFPASANSVPSSSLCELNQLLFTFHLLPHTKVKATF